jgi:regulatory protein
MASWRMASRPGTSSTHPGDPPERPSAGLPGVGPPPDRARLHGAALAHLARFATTEAGLRRVLERRIDRWARAAAAEKDQDEIAAAVAAARDAARAVVARLAASGAVSDAAFAEARARSLRRAGRSARAVAAHLAAKGVAAETARAVLPDDAEAELAAALAFARRRRIGPFRAGEAPDADRRRRELGMLARGGFSQDTARRALATDLEEAEALVNRLRQT